MLRSIATVLQQEIADQFNLTATDSETGGPRDVLWCPAEIALRNRMEQSSLLGRTPEVHTPFLSFWRIAERLNKPRMNVPLVWSGAFTGVDPTRRYNMIPVDLVFQIEHWADREVDHETAIENFFKWSAPPGELVMTDVNGVTFQMPLGYMDPEDNSRIPEIYDIGRLHRETMVMTVSGYVITDTGEGSFKAIQEITWNVWDYSAYGTTEDAVLLKEMPPITQGIYYDAGYLYDDGHRYSP